jgi:hypothetical protein
MLVPFQIGRPKGFGTGECAVPTSGHPRIANNKTSCPDVGVNLKGPQGAGTTPSAEVPHLSTRGRACSQRPHDANVSHQIERGERKVVRMKVLEMLEVPVHHDRADLPDYRLGSCLSRLSLSTRMSSTGSLSTVRHA